MPDQKSAHIAIIDPHAVLRLGIKSLLSGSGHKVCWESECSASARPLMDSKRPHMVIYEPIFEMAESISFLAFLQTTHPELKVIVQTMTIDNVEVGRLLNQGVLALVSKRGSPEELMLAVESAFTGQAYVSPHILNGMRNGTRGASVDVSLLTAREREVFRLVGLGQKASTIAKNLGISPRTVDAHKQHIKDKLSLTGNIGLAAAAGCWLQRNWVNPDGTGI